jgi:hypothetical protein
VISTNQFKNGTHIEVDGKVFRIMEFQHVKPGKAFECAWTASLDGGQITVQGPFLDSSDSELAITGGTGDYDTASGTMSLHARNDKGTEYDFTYEVNTDG